jgi:hypothetical protein
MRFRIKTKKDCKAKLEKIIIMNLPNKEYNIYPKNEENINAVLSYYFDKYLLFEKKEAISFLMENNILSMNQLEFIARKLSESWHQLFENFFREKTTSYKNIMNYGICGLTLPESKWTYSIGSSARPKIREFIEFVKNTETDFDFLSINN